MKERNIHLLEKTATPQSYASSEEVEFAVRALTPGDRKKLLLSARFWWRKFGLHYSELQPEDLLQEAVCRALSGDRKWPKHVSFIKFISQTIKSIAGHHRTSRESELDRINQKITDGSSDQDSKIDAAAEVEKIRIFFGEDTQGFEVLKLKAEGLDGVEIMEALELDEKEWETVRKRVQRKVAKYIASKEEE
ncbi:sigma-70 RNA polymerase sigma factor region 4 domain-containing protein [Bdellovibrio reynosensis]|uniref:Sigma-70 family RNA polymerase sigma factor n=1 Tax=Bdellovibrio reynosensis TaxID=2835041 RepID=A0ABY4CDG6_9BACT|nr:hypothetical protein [Bdellovibrio reynosensis]UOF02883.1 hypothetical protein MNR06_07945 [Bdellovibrio reynosensis]